MDTLTPKSAIITLHGGSSTMTLLASRKANGTVVTNVVLKDGKSSSKGMTEVHESMDKAKAHLATLAKQAEKLGWQRRAGAGFAARPDAFGKLPAAPKAEVTK